MTERPNTVLGLLISVAGVMAALVGAALTGVFGTGLVALAVAACAAFSTCLFFLVAFGDLPPSSIFVAFVAGASTVAFAWTALRYLREQRLLRGLPAERLHNGRLREVARAAGANEVLVSPASRPAAFCVGIIRPRVVITKGLLDRLNSEEQAAVVWHEVHHLRGREPLKCLVGRLAAGTFFWIPSLGDLLERYLLAKELAADSLAVERTSRRALAGALVEVVGEPTPTGAVGLAEYAAARVDRLFDPHASLPPLFRFRRLMVSALAAAGVVTFVALTGGAEASRAVDLRSMLSTMSAAGLPGMAAGLAANGAIMAILVVVARRLRR